MLDSLVLNSKTDHLVFVFSVIVLICWLLFSSSFEMLKMVPTKKLSLAKMSSVIVGGMFRLSRKFKDLLVGMQTLAEYLFLVAVIAGLMKCRAISSHMSSTTVFALFYYLFWGLGSTYFTF